MSANRSKLTIKDEEFIVAIADNEKSQFQGLSEIPSLGKRKGMLFVFTEPKVVRMVMRDMNFPLSMLFLNDNFKIVQMGVLAPGEDNSITSSSEVSYVVELHESVITDLSLSIGDKVDCPKELMVHCCGVKKYKHGGNFQQIGDVIYEVKVDDIAPDKESMQLLDENGVVVANVKPNSRVFSREHTKELITLHKAGNKIELAKAMVDIIDIQSKQSPDYVKN